MKYDTADRWSRTGGGQSKADVSVWSCDFLGCKDFLAAWTRAAQAVEKCFIVTVGAVRIGCSGAEYIKKETPKKVIFLLGVGGLRVVEVVGAAVGVVVGHVA